jgi:microcystin degradation protein MlrC
MRNLRIYAAGLGTETNTFSAWRTGANAFEEQGVFRSTGSQDNQRVETRVLRAFREHAEADGHDFQEGLLTFAQPSGPTVHAVYEGFRDEIVGGIRAAGRLDMVLLYMHGAMVSTECDDCEGDLTAIVRAIVGPDVIIGVELDLHCHLSAAMVENADAIVIMKEYPHDDYLDRAAELYQICVAAARRDVHPVMAMFDCRMVGFYPTTTEPMASLVREAIAAEQRPGVLSVSIAHGFPWGDTPDTGTKVLAIADGDIELARNVAAQLGRSIYNQRDALLPTYPSIARALDETAGFDGVTLLADTADNAGGGAPSDNTALLEEMLERGLDNFVLGPLWDPIAAAICVEAGVGTTLPLRVGGKVGPASARTLDLEVTVKAIISDYSQTGLGGGRQPLGLTVWVQLAGRIDLVINTTRTQAFYPDLFTGLGIALEERRYVVVKSSHHYYTGFAPIADHVVPVATPGALQMNFADIDYRKKRDLEFHPRISDPLGLD